MADCPQTPKPPVPLTSAPSLLDFQILYMALRCIEAISAIPANQDRPAKALAEAGVVASRALAKVRAPAETT